MAQSWAFATAARCTMKSAWFRLARRMGRWSTAWRRSAKQHNLDVEEFDAQELTARFPGFRAAENTSAIFERRAGYLDVETCVVAHAEQARRLMAELLTGITVHGCARRRKKLNGRHRSRRIPCPTAGSRPRGRAPQVLGALPLRLVVRRKPQYWFPAGPDYQAGMAARHFCSRLRRASITACRKSTPGD